MARVWNLKTCLFCLIGLVVGLTLLLITKFQSSSAAVSRWDTRPLRLANSGNDEDLAAYYNPNHAYPVAEAQQQAAVVVGSVKSDTDYPFEDDFVNQDTDLNQEERTKGKDEDVKDEDVEPEGGGDYQGRIDGGGPGRNPVKLTAAKKTTTATQVVCDVNSGKFILECRKEDNEVYIPFSFIHKYFEVYGKMSEKGDKFIWLHSNPKIYRPKSPYDPKGVFTYFENYNVEVRDRVKCISGATGVPISTQWDRNGYFYPIQIAQFGLAHYSKFMNEGKPERVILEDGDEVHGKWAVRSKSDVVTVREPLHDSNHIVQIQHASVAFYVNYSETASQPISLDVSNSNSRLLVLSWDMRTDTSLSLTEDAENSREFNATLTATIRYENHEFFLHYVTADFHIYVEDNHIYHGLGKQSFSRWHRVIRDLGVDVQKGVSFSRRKGGSKILRAKLSLESLAVHVPPSPGPDAPTVRLYLDNITLSTNEHLAQFFQSADWFVQQQDERGGWPIPVRRKFAADFYPVLESGWYSGMAQGHALSVLARAHALTGKAEYSKACGNALKQIFDHGGSEHGVKAVFMDKYIWYEEYPTTPSTFVLNGFMYALLGLYDVKVLGIPDAAEKAAELYDQGLSSLKTMLPLYDTGAGTMYDLRHFTVPGITPNPARLDYHVTHINQLLTFATFESDPIFRTTAERWIKYTQGDRAPHN